MRRLAALVQERLDLGTGDAEERADDAVIADGVDAAKPGQAAPGEEAHEDRLGLVVLLMRRRDVARAGLRPYLLQLGDAYCPRRRLDAGVAQPFGIERPIGDDQLHLQSLTQLPHVLLVPVRLLAAQVMVHMRSDDLEAGQLRHHEQQRRRVEAAGNGNHDPARLDRVIGKEGGDGVRKRHSDVFCRRAATICYPLTTPLHKSRSEEPWQKLSPYPLHPPHPRTMRRSIASRSSCTAASRWRSTSAASRGSCSP